jgi:hypothetical protein
MAITKSDEKWLIKEEEVKDSLKNQVPYFKNMIALIIAGGDSMLTVIGLEERLNRFFLRDLEINSKKKLKRK